MNDEVSGAGLLFRRGGEQWCNKVSRRMLLRWLAGWLSWIAGHSQSRPQIHTFAGVRDEGVGDGLGISVCVGTN